MSGAGDHSEPTAADDAGGWAPRIENDPGWLTMAGLLRNRPITPANLFPISFVKAASKHEVYLMPTAINSYILLGEYGPVDLRAASITSLHEPYFSKR